MDLSALGDFHRVATSGSLSKASRESGRPKATLSRRIRQLEESLGVRLVERGRHALRLTADGQALYERTHTLLRDIEEAGQNVASGGEWPRGLLRVSVPVLFADAHGGRLATEFILRYPDVHLELLANDRHIDLVDEGVDVADRELSGATALGIQGVRGRGTHRTMTYLPRPAYAGCCRSRVLATANGGWAGSYRAQTAEQNQRIGHERIRQSLLRQGLRPVYRRHYRIA